MFVFRRKVRIAWAECDAAGIVFYPRYFEMFDTSTQMMFEAATGLTMPELASRHGIVGVPMVDTRARFVVASRPSDHVEIESRVGEWRRSSFDVTHRILRGETLAVEGFETRVWAGPDPDNPGGLRGRPVPADIKAAFKRKA